VADVVLRAQRLTKRFGSLVAVDHLTLEVERGEILGFLGPNGAGKTTAINMLCGLLAPDEGSVEIEGRPVTSGDAEVRTCIGMCPQDVVVWDTLTCAEQLRFVGEMYGLDGRDAERRGRGVLDDLGLGDRADRPARTLSGGMRRRLNLALALVHDPEIVVLDEPEAGLDPQSRVRVREYVLSMARRRTVILTTQNMDEADRVADRVAIVDHGRLLVLDATEALKRSVGEGDVVEIVLDEGISAKTVTTALASVPGVTRVVVAGGVAEVGVRGAVGALPSILDALAAGGLACRDLRLRENTLEDVFISLTGRRLRE